MTTSKPRITVNLTPAGSQALKRLSAAGGGTQSSIVAEFMDMAAPILERTATMLDLAARAKATSRDALRSDLDAAQGRLEGHLGLLNGEMDRLMASMGASAPAGAGTACGAEPAAASTPISNRGVRTGKTRTHGPSKARGGKS